MWVQLVYFLTIVSRIAYISKVNWFRDATHLYCTNKFLLTLGHPGLSVPHTEQLLGLVQSIFHS